MTSNRVNTQSTNSSSFPITLGVKKDIANSPQDEGRSVGDLPAKHYCDAGKSLSWDMIKNTICAHHTALWCKGFTKGTILTSY
jgi:hypothetical protein